MRISKIAAVGSIAIVILIAVLVFLFKVTPQQNEFELKKTEVTSQKTDVTPKQAELESKKSRVVQEQPVIEPKATDQSLDTTVSGSDPSFHIEQRTSDEMSGYFIHESSRVTFHGFMETPFYARAQVQVNDITLDASADLKENLKVIDGHGMALSENDRLALQALSMKFEGFLKPYEQKMPEHEDLLFRVTLYLSEAPVGMPIVKLEAQPPQNP